MSVHNKRSDLYMCQGCGDCVHRDEPVVETGGGGAVDDVIREESQKAEDDDVLRETCGKLKKSKKAERAPKGEK